MARMDNGERLRPEMSKRFRVSACSGFLTAVVGGSPRPLACSFVVTDTEINHRAMGEFRSEDFVTRTSGGMFTSLEDSKRAAKYAAQKLAARLERECARSACG